MRLAFRSCGSVCGTHADLDCGMDWSSSRSPSLVPPHGSLQTQYGRTDNAPGMLQASPQEVFFGTEYRNPDVAQFGMPIEAVAAVFFVLIALMFVGHGQVLGRAFDAYPNPVLGYTLNLRRSA